jgi:hypothetical protein
MPEHAIVSEFVFLTALPGHLQLATGAKSAVPEIFPANK